VEKLARILLQIRSKATDMCSNWSKTKPLEKSLLKRLRVVEMGES
jgi:hypothetical protein